jgi:hypothetical protein
MRKIIIPLALAMMTFSMAEAQQTGDIQREVRLYNPFRPTLSEAGKKSFFPDMTDTTSMRHEFTYKVTPEPFSPPYTVSQIRPAALLADPLPRLYKSWLNIGFGNYFTPVGELSITNERSRSGMLAFYARHYSSNGKIQLENNKRVPAGYMDNDAVLYGKKFMQSSLLSGSLDFTQMTRHAYGYDTLFTTWEPEREDIRLSFMSAGASAAISSLRADSGSLVYDFGLGYNYFRQSAELWQHDVKINFDAGKSIRALTPRRAPRRSGVSHFYGRVRGSYELSLFDNAVEVQPRHILTVNPALSKKSNEWSFNLGVRAVTETRRHDIGTLSEDYKTRLHIYPDINLNIAVIPSFLSFHLGLEGDLANNSVTETVRVNPFIITDGSLYRIPYTDNEIVARIGLSGSVIPSTTYKINGSYTVFRDMLFFSNVVWDGGAIFPEGVGNFFVPVMSDGNLANVGAELNTAVTPRLSAKLKADYYSYTLTDIAFPYNKPAFDGSVRFRYNLRDKIIAGAGLNAIGKRTAFITPMTLLGPPPSPVDDVELPMYINMNLSAEYRYTKILSFWVRMSNMSFNRHYEWAYYPSQRFMFMAGFSYSL